MSHAAALEDRCALFEGLAKLHKELSSRPDQNKSKEASPKKKSRKKAEPEEPVKTTGSKSTLDLVEGLVNVLGEWRCSYQMQG